MSNPRASALQYADQKYAVFLEELKEFTAIPSISTELDYQAEMQRAAEWVARRSHRLNLRAL